VPGDDAEIGKPAQILPGGLGVTVGAVGDHARRRRLAGLQDGAIDALFDVVTRERILEGWRPIGGVRLGYACGRSSQNMLLTSGNSVLIHNIIRSHRYAAFQLQSTRYHRRVSLLATQSHMLQTQREDAQLPGRLSGYN
jgi:hypothetical protein